MISKGSIPCSRSGTRATSISIPTSPLLAISLAAEVRPAAPRSCSETSSPRSSSSRQHSISFFSANGSPICTLGRLDVVALPQLGRREHRGSADAVAAGGGAEQDEQVARPGGGGADQPLARREPDAHRVDQAVLLVGALEVDLAADGRHADRVAVVADSRDRVVEQVARALARGIAEAQRVEHGDRPRADREDVAEDPADAGRRALEGLDRARVVVGLDLEGDREAAADVDGAGVLAGAHHEPRALRRERAQQRLGVLVGAVLGPQQREHRELDLDRLAVQARDDQLVLAGGQPEGERAREAGDGRRGRGTPLRAPAQPVERLHAAAAASEANTPRPPVDPVSGSTACSGCGIRPNTLPRSLTTPAMSSSEPLGFSPGA